MGKKRSNRYSRLVAGFAASAFALLTVATVQYQAADDQIAQITGKSSLETHTYQYRRMHRCADDIRDSKQRTISRVCRLLDNLR